MTFPASFSRLGGVVAACALICGPVMAQEAQELWQADGFALPESVLWDAGTGLYYVSNMGVDPMAKDGDGFIATLDATGAVMNMAFAAGLDSPKGMAVSGGTLYVSDIDSVKAIDLATGAVTASYAGDGVVFLNDVTIAPDGTVYVSDTFGNAVFKIEGEGLVLVARGEGLAGANGLMPGPEGKLLVANLGDVSGGFENIVPGWAVVLDLATGTVEAYGASEPPGILDGIVSDGKGGVILTDNAAGTVLHQMPGGAPGVIATIASGAADLDYDTETGIIVVPITPEGRVVALKWSPM
jgi:DNA-binding beta-propeller fold protein YncE